MLELLNLEDITLTNKVQSKKQIEDSKLSPKGTQPRQPRVKNATSHIPLHSLFRQVTGLSDDDFQIGLCRPDLVTQQPQSSLNSSKAAHLGAGGFEV